MDIKDIVFVYHLKESNLINWHSRVHSHDEGQFEIHYFLSGSGQFRNGQTVYDIRPGELFLSYPMEIHGIQPGTLTDPLSYYAVLFELEPGRDAEGVDLFDPRIPPHFPLSVGNTLRLQFEDMKNRYNSPNPFLKLSAAYRMLAFLFDMLGGILSDDPDFRGENDGPSDVYVEQAMDIFQRHVFETIRLSEVSARLRISEEHLIKSFRRKIGITPMRYFQNLKLETGVSLLLNTNQSIKEISGRLGFSSQYHFSRNFKIHSGLSPSDYRLRYFRESPTKYHTKIVE